MKTSIILIAILILPAMLTAQQVCDTTYEWHKYEYLRVDVGSGWEFDLTQVKDSVRVVKTVFCHEKSQPCIDLEADDIWGITDNNEKSSCFLNKKNIYNRQR